MWECQQWGKLIKIRSFHHLDYSTRVVGLFWLSRSKDSILVRLTIVIHSTKIKPPVYKQGSKGIIQEKRATWTHNKQTVITGQNKKHRRLTVTIYRDRYLHTFVNEAVSSTFTNLFMITYTLVYKWKHLFLHVYNFL